MIRGSAGVPPPSDGNYVLLGREGPPSIFTVGRYLRRIGGRVDGIGGGVMFFFLEFAVHSTALARCSI
jgi:hypothetical protein